MQDCFSLLFNLLSSLICLNPGFCDDLSLGDNFSTISLCDLIIDHSLHGTLLFFLKHNHLAFIKDGSLIFLSCLLDLLNRFVFLMVIIIEHMTAGLLIIALFEINHRLLVLLDLLIRHFLVFGLS